MARSKGYRPTKQNAEEVLALRAKLAECRYTEWQRASCLMAQIADLTQGGGPSGGAVVPRACKYCGYYGHTRQHCQLMYRDEEAETERVLLRDEWQRAQLRAHFMRPPPEPLPWQRATQEEWFDELGIPWERDVHIGPTLLEPGKDGGQGKWVRVGGTVKQAVE